MNAVFMSRKCGVVDISLLLSVDGTKRGTGLRARADMREATCDPSCPDEDYIDN